MLHVFLTLLLIASFIVPSPTEAQPKSSFPKEAYTSCRGKGMGKGCWFQGPDGVVKGICRKPPRTSRVVCVPKGHREHRYGSHKPKTHGNGIGRPPARKHTVTQSSGTLELIPATVPHKESSQVQTELQDSLRVVHANGIPTHSTGPFPNGGNPHRIQSQKYVVTVPLKPSIAGTITPLGRRAFGIGVNGVPFDPGAAEWYLGNQEGNWQYEPLSGAIALGLDGNHAHVQPSGAYHYHGLPTLLLQDLDLQSTRHSPLVGWAADGFPIYALYGYQNSSDPTSKVVLLQSGYQLRAGKRPSGKGNPGGSYDGTFVQDYAFRGGLGRLDECNGRFTVTPEFPQGTYAYFLTENWPVIPRCYKGTPNPF